MHGPEIQHSNVDSMEVLLVYYFNKCVLLLCVFYLGENGEMSCLSLAQFIVGGGTLWTSHGKMASSPSITDILIGSAEPPLPPTLDLGRTGQTYTETVTQLKVFRHIPVQYVSILMYK